MESIFFPFKLQQACCSNTIRPQKDEKGRPNNSHVYRRTLELNLNLPERQRLPVRAHSGGLGKRYALHGCMRRQASIHRRRRRRQRTFTYSHPPRSASRTRAHTHTSTCKPGCLSEAVRALTTVVDSNLISCAAVLVRRYESPHQHTRELSGLGVQ